MALGEALTVLVVDDDDDVRDTLCAVLADHGMRVLSARHGEEALATLRGEPARPLVVLLDVMMPVMDGYRFREAQRSDPRIADVPVVVCTAHDDARRAARVMGAAGALTKPISLAALLAAVRAAAA